SVLKHSLEHRLQIAGRTRDNAKHLGRRRLLLQRLGELARARLHLVEQPHVLDRDHRLVGEGGQQVDLLIGECADGKSSKSEYAYQRSLSHERNTQHGMKSKTLLRLRQRVFRVGSGVLDMHRSTIEQYTSDQSFAARLQS